MWQGVFRMGLWAICAGLVLAGDTTRADEGLPEGVDALLAVSPDQVEGEVNPHVYGQFLEHIYHSVCDGLGGELVRNRCFMGGDRWDLDGGVLREKTGATDQDDIVFGGDTAWTDYELTLEARKTGGNEGFLIVFRAQGKDDFCWWNLGGWGNKSHALEVESGGARHIATPMVGGSIEQNRWYRIRVRVEGDHLEGWLDDAKLLDTRDATRHSGCIGLNTWATKAEFRNVRVTDLAGAALPCELRLPKQSDAAAPWLAYPSRKPEVDVIETASPNSGYSARVELGGKERGIIQPRFLAAKGHHYTGTAWLAADGEVSSVRALLLGANGSVLSEARLKTPSGGPWTECPFELRSEVDDPQASLAIVAEGDGALVVDMVSLMRDDSLGSGCRQDLLDAVKGLAPPIIRWPGGCFASIYRWKVGIGPQHERTPFLNSVWGEWDDSSFGTDEYLRLCEEVGAEPLIVLNLGSWDSPDKWREYLAEALEWVEYVNGDVTTPMGKLRAENGHPTPYGVTHFELDNETWAMGLEAYTERLRPFAEGIRQRWPEVKLYACTFWNAEDPKLLELVGDRIDFISYHLYDDPNAFATGPLAHEADWRQYTDFIAKSRNPEAKLAVTEWNAQSTDWRTGLFCGGILNVMERNETITMATPALFLRRVDATAWDNAFINHDHQGWFPAPNYVVMKLYREHFLPERVALEAQGPLNTVATRSEDGSRLVLKVVNPTDQPVRTRVRLGEGVTSGRQWVVEARLTERNTLEEPNHIAPRESTLSVAPEFAHTFPAYSVTVIEVERR